jgi:hypothetical protein
MKVNYSDFRRKEIIVMMYYFKEAKDAISLILSKRTHI